MARRGKARKVGEGRRQQGKGRQEQVGKTGTWGQRWHCVSQVNVSKKTNKRGIMGTHTGANEQELG